MSLGERWLLLAVFAPLVAVVVIIAILRVQQWVRARRARDTNRRLNRLE